MTAIPPLLMLCEGRKPRPRKAPKTAEKEIVLHMAIAKILRDHCRPEWRWTHVPNGELRDVRTAAKLKRMGAQPGWPDIILVPPEGHLHALEFKRIGETLSDPQRNFQAWCIRHAIPYVVAWTLDEALAALDHWGCLRIRIGGAL